MSSYQTTPTEPTPSLPDPHNANILVWINGQLLPRNNAKVSVFDSVVQGGDAVWEGLRIYKGGRIAQLEEHLQRMIESAHAMAFTQIPSKKQIKQAIAETVKANNMTENAHIRLTLTRGKKVTSGMSPHFNQYGPTLIVLAEWKKPVYPSTIRLITSAIRRNNPQFVDSKIHHNNLINNILAKIQANGAGVDDALMLDLNGFVSETNATNVFIIKRGEILTPHADSCLPGITRYVVIKIAKERGIPLCEKNISLTEVYTADEMFTTGTMGELSPVVEVDYRKIGDGNIGRLTRLLQEYYHEWNDKHATPVLHSNL